MNVTYDSDNIFAKILRGEIPCKKVYEDDYALAFHDMYPDAPVHILIVPKGEYRDFMAFSTQATPAMVHGFFAAVAAVAKQEGVVEAGFRLITNNGKAAEQAVHHFHLHLVAGQPLGPILPRR